MPRGLGLILAVLSRSAYDITCSLSKSRGTVTNAGWESCRCHGIHRSKGTERYVGKECCNCSVSRRTNLMVEAENAAKAVDKARPNREEAAKAIR